MLSVSPLALPILISSNISSLIRAEPMFSCKVIVGLDSSTGCFSPTPISSCPSRCALPASYIAASGQTGAGAMPWIAK